MIFESPKLNHEDAAVLEMISEQRERLQYYTNQNPRRWLGSLRRATIARAIQASNSIEGYNVTLDEAVAAVEDEPILDQRTETSRAIRGYRDAMTYILQATKDPHFEISAQLLKSLHFMMLQYDMSKNPGQWRPGGIFVINSKTGERVYDAPDVEFVNGLIEELVAYLKTPSNEQAVIRAAMAHLNLAMIHPFSDGNGRIARALQTLVIASDGVPNPVFSSIEEWLGDNTQEYYDILALVGQGKWNPQNNALPWIRFCLKAHYQQAGKFIRRNEEAEALFSDIMKLIDLYGLQERTWAALFDAAIGLRISNARYRKDAQITEYTASRDLKKLCEVELIVPHGEKKMRTYTAAKILADAWQRARIKRAIEDPYELVTRKLKGEAAETAAKEAPRLPGI